MGIWSFGREKLVQSFLKEAVSLVSFLWDLCTWAFPWGFAAPGAPSWGGDSPQGLHLPP